MSAVEHREYTLTCDADGCTARFGLLHREPSRARLRRLAAKEGWTHDHEDGTPRRYDRDYCPSHKPGTPEKTP